MQGDGAAVVLDAGSAEGGVLIVPGGEFLLHAEYVKKLGVLESVRKVYAG